MTYVDTVYPFFLLVVSLVNSTRFPAKIEKGVCAQSCGCMFFPDRSASSLSG